MNKLKLFLVTLAVLLTSAPLPAQIGGGIDTGVARRVVRYTTPPTCAATLKGFTYYDTDDNTIYFCNGTSWGSLAAGAGSSSTTQVLFNSAGVITGEAAFTYTAGTNTLNLDNIVGNGTATGFTNILYLATNAAQTLQPTTDVVGLIVKQFNGVNTADIFQVQTDGSVVAFGVDKDGAWYSNITGPLAFEGSTGACTVSAADKIKLCADTTNDRWMVSYNGGALSNVLLATDWAAPGAIGGTTPAAGTFTTLSGTTSVTSPIFTTNAADPADAGLLRLANAECIVWEASPAGTDSTLCLSSTETLTYTTKNGTIWTIEPLASGDIFKWVGDNASAIKRVEQADPGAGITNDDIWRHGLVRDGTAGELGGDGGFTPVVWVNNNVSTEAMLCIGNIANANTNDCRTKASNIIFYGTFGTDTNCADSAGDAACTAASSGAFVIDAADTNTVVSTTAVTANSQIYIQEDSGLGTRLGVTCNTTIARSYAVTARTAATSFTITASAAPVTNPACLNFTIIN